MRIATALALRHGDRERLTGIASSRSAEAVQARRGRLGQFLDGRNDRWQPFVWTQTADDVLTKV